MGVKDGNLWVGSFSGGREKLYDLPEPRPQGTGGPAFERIARVLAEAIAMRVYRQGTRLPPSQAIAARFGVSKDTARAAVARLAELDLVYRHPRGGTYVKGAVGQQQGRG